MTQRSDSSGADEVLSGGGELGARLRAIDWSKTPLGPVASWPHSLKTCVRIILTSRQPMFVWWGDELINLYNDAYTSILGGKHPQALAAPASVVWSEIWSQIRPRVDATMRNEGTYDEALLLIMERNGYPEETYYTFSYSPVRTDDGGTGGIICANTDDTQRIINERQIASLREQAARTLHARTVAEACEKSAQALGTNRRDVPFALLYVAERDGELLALRGATGIEPGHPAAPEVVSFGARAPWPFAEVRATGEERVIALDDSFGPFPGGAWSRPPCKAIVLPIARPGEEGPAGVVIVGLNPFRLFDDAYQTFLRLVVGQIAASVASAQAYEDEKRRREAIAELDRAKTTFFSNVSHEFRTPLTLMLGPIEDLRSAASPNGEERERLDLLQRNALRLLKLVNNLLDFSRLESGRVEASYEATDLAALTADLASTFRSAVERAGLAFVVDCPPLGAPSYVDRGMWEKIVLNLLSNAFKFTFEGAITVRLRGTDRGAELEVADTGTGIPAAAIPRLFERFHRVEGARSRSHEGSGIGLALVHELVRMHAGTIDVQSREGAGTTFRVEIPRGSAEQAKGPKASDSQPDSAVAEAYVEEARRWDSSRDGLLPGAPGEASSASGRPRILVADDNADMRAYLARLLGAHWDVEVVADGAQALAAIRGRAPDLVVSDVMMPGLDGFALLRAVRSDPAVRSTPIVLLSARAGAEATAEGLAAGADDYIVKPFASRDLLVRVAARLAAAHGAREIDDQRRRLYRHFMQAPFPVAVLRGPTLIVELANEAMLRTWQKSPAVVGLPLRVSAPELGGALFERLEAVYRSGEPYEGKAQRASLPAGSRGVEPIDTYWNVVYVPLFDAKGAIEGVMISAFEVTDQIQATRALEAANRAEQDAMRRALEAETSATRKKDEFMAMLGHELRNPLAPIVTATSLIRMRGRATGEELDILERQSRHLVRLVDDLLDISRITSGKLSLDRAPVSLGDVVTQALESTSPIFSANRVSLQSSVMDAPIVVEGDRDRLVQVLTNLLVNAAKFTPAGRSVHLSARRANGEGVVVVRDEGAGVSPDLLPRIFDVFTQGAQGSDRRTGGLGLGLAIARSIVSAHGGSIEAKSAGVGRGATFEVRIPLISALAASAPERPSSERPASPHSKWRVLVVDDNRDGAEMIAEYLGAIGYAPVIAFDGPEALTALRADPADVALLDIGLPDMDGYELAQTIASELGPNAPKLIAMTGYAQPSDRARAIDAGFVEHIAKPVDLAQLAATLQRIVTRPPPTREAV
ncbi:MAG TPA: ATP-binding protein [Polyangiaceae bacterium]|jgi:signal transduction histidine kinase